MSEPVHEESMQHHYGRVITQERVKQLETRIIHWTRQVRVVARAPEGGVGRASPLDELAFWRARLADLTGIREQLQLPGMQPCVLSVGRVT